MIFKFLPLRQCLQDNTVLSKKPKRMCTFDNEWLVKYAWLKQIPDDNSRALCKNKLFTISHGGENIKKHASGTQHKQLHNQVCQNHFLSTFITTGQKFLHCFFYFLKKILVLTF
jgi:hypothetical protein